MTQGHFTKLMAFLERLDEVKIAHSLKHSREGAISVHIDVPGERWEVDFLEDGDIDVERFAGNGKIYGEEALAELFAKYSD